MPTPPSVPCPCLYIIGCLPPRGFRLSHLHGGGHAQAFHMNERPHNTYTSATTRAQLPPSTPTPSYTSWRFLSLMLPPPPLLG